MLSRLTDVCIDVWSVCMRCVGGKNVYEWSVWCAYVMCGVCICIALCECGVCVVSVGCVWYV